MRRKVGRRPDDQALIQALAAREKQKKEKANPA
jgi:hypothetical protein